jgi:hypothetical protein
MQSSSKSCRENGKPRPLPFDMLLGKSCSVSSRTSEQRERRSGIHTAESIDRDDWTTLFAKPKPGAMGPGSALAGARLSGTTAYVSVRPSPSCAPSCLNCPKERANYPSTPSWRAIELRGRLVRKPTFLLTGPFYLYIRTNRRGSRRVWVSNYRWLTFGQRPGSRDHARSPNVRLTTGRSKTPCRRARCAGRRASGM